MHTHAAAAAAAVLVIRASRTKLHLDQMGVPLTGSWEEATQTLTITSSSVAPDDDLQQDGTSTPTAAAAAAEEQQEGAEQQQQQQQLPPEMLLGSSNFDLQQWLQCLQQGVINRQHIQHAELPLQVRTKSVSCRWESSSCVAVWMHGACYSVPVLSVAGAWHA
jgi:hypothetical protein